jgi:hypothetical protein
LIPQPLSGFLCSQTVACGIPMRVIDLVEELVAVRGGISKGRHQSEKSDAAAGTNGLKPAFRL